MLRAKKYRLYPSQVQIAKLEQHFGCCRLIWNLALETKTMAWESNRNNLSRFDLQKQMLDLKKEYNWLYQTYSGSLQSVLLHLDNAYKSFFKGGGHPRFKKKSGNQSFQIPSGVKIYNNSIRIPKVETIRCEGVKPFIGEIRTVTISRTSTGKYYASILIKTDEQLPTKPQIKPETAVGIDVGIKSFLTLSNGVQYETNRYLKNSLKRLQCLNRRLSKKKKGSNNSKKAKLCVAKLHEKIANQRADYIHKITTGLVRNSQAETFVIESLNVSSMVKNRCLSQALSDVSFGEFFRLMEYKCNWYGKNLIKIGTFEPSSKMCCCCGHVNKELTLGDREWTCPGCNTTHDRDFNAAINIKEIGLKKYSGEGISGEPVKSRRLRRVKKQETY